MLRNFVLLLLIVFIGSCTSNEQPSEFTGNQVTYSLIQASQYTVSGSVTYKEMRDGNTLVLVELKGTAGESKYPVHLHLGDLSVQGASVAGLLEPIVGNIGYSQTILKQLADETPVNYTNLTKLNSCIKIHLASTGPQKDIVLAASNVGSASAKPLTSGRLGISICGSN